VYVLSAPFVAVAFARQANITHASQHHPERPAARCPRWPAGRSHFESSDIFPPQSMRAASSASTDLLHSPHHNGEECEVGVGINSARSRRAVVPTTSPAQSAAQRRKLDDNNEDVVDDNNDNADIAKASRDADRKGVLPDTSKWNWVPCDNRPELLTYVDGKKRWFHCSLCEYWNDRLYHTKVYLRFVRLFLLKSFSQPLRFSLTLIIQQNRCTTSAFTSTRAGNHKQSLLAAAV
jgi:hypothetical protein